MRNSRFAGELLVAAELSRLGLSVSFHNLLGANTQHFDLSVCNERGLSVQIQVKALKNHNAFLIDPEKILELVVYVFVVVNEAGTLPEFYVVSGKDLLKSESELFGKFGRNYSHQNGRSINSRSLPAEWKNNWTHLGLGRFS